MEASRSASVFMIRGSSILPRMPKTTAKTMVPMISSGQVGTSGSCAAASARRCVMMTCPFPGACRYPARLSGREDERGDQTDQGERLGQGEADPHVQGDP